MFDLLGSLYTPNLIFYGTYLLMLTILYHKKLKLFFAFVYSATVMFFLASWWEIPIRLTQLVTNGHYEFLQLAETGLFLTYFFPFLLCIGIFNIKLIFTKWKFLGLILGFVVVSIQILFSPSYFSYHITSLITFVFTVPRIVNAFFLGFVCYPNVDKTRFGISNTHSLTSDTSLGADS